MFLLTCWTTNQIDLVISWFQKCVVPLFQALNHYVTLGYEILMESIWTCDLRWYCATFSKLQVFKTVLDQLLDLLTRNSHFHRSNACSCDRNQKVWLANFCLDLLICLKIDPWLLNCKITAKWFLDIQYLYCNSNYAWNILNSILLSLTTNAV